MLSTAQKGAIAEAAIVEAATRAGIPVARPLAPERYDLVFDLGSRLLRVQCKWAVRRRGAIVVRCYSSSRGREGLVRRFYSERDVDAIAAYCPDTDRCYFLPASWIDGRHTVQLRTEPARNNQGTGIVWADAFEFESLDWEKPETGP